MITVCLEKKFTNHTQKESREEIIESLEKCNKFRKVKMNCENNNMNLHQNTQSIADYLAQLLKDRKQLAAFPNVFNHVERLLDEGELYTSIRSLDHDPLAKRTRLTSSGERLGIEDEDST